MIKKPVTVTRESIEDNTKNIKDRLECTLILNLSLLNVSVGQEAKHFKRGQGCSKSLNVFTKWVVDQWNSLPNCIVDVTCLHIEVHERQNH